MASVGGLACSIVRGNLTAKKIRTNVWEVAGINGYGAQQAGYGDSPFRVTAVLYSTAAGVQTWANLLAAMQGSVVTIINDWGNTFTGCLLVRVSEPQKTPAVGAGGCRGEVILEGVVT